MQMLCSSNAVAMYSEAKVYFQRRLSSPEKSPTPSIMGQKERLPHSVQGMRKPMFKVLLFQLLEDDNLTHGVANFHHIDTCLRCAEGAADCIEGGELTA